MKILTLISGGDVGGAKTHVLTLIQRLNLSIEAHLICFKEGAFASDARALGIPTRVLNSGSILKDLAVLRELAVKERFDIIHSHGSRGNFMAALIKKQVKLPTISTVHSDYKLDYMGRPLAALTYGNLNKVSLRKLDYLIGVSDVTSELLIDRGFNPDSVFTIYNGVDMQTTNPEQDRAAFLDSHGLRFPEDSVIVGIAARLDPVKDHATLLRGFKLAADCDNRLRLLLAGDGAEENALKKLAAELGIADKTAFLGWVQDTNSFYNAIDINALTSISETFSYALTEGSRFSLATVSSDVGGVRRLIDDRVNGLLFSPGDSDALAACLLEYSGNPEKRKNFGELLREKTGRCFSLDATCRTQLEIYETVVRRKLKPSGKRYGIAVCGSYGTGNTGDEAILEAILSEIRAVDPDIPVYVLSKNPKMTRRVNRVRSMHTFSLPAFYRASSKIGLYINGGGTLIQDGTSRRSLWFYLYTIYMAKKRGAKVCMYGCGIGPVTRHYNRKLAGHIINKYADVITLREDGSIAELADMGVTKPLIRLAADPATALNEAPSGTIDSEMLRRGLDPAGHYICFMVRKWTGFSAKIADFANAADYAFEKHGLTPVFFPIDCEKDVEAARQVAKFVQVPCHILESAPESGVIIGIMSRMNLIVSMRLHGLIFAAGHGSPLIGIVYDPKVSSFLRYIGQDNYMELADVSAQKLSAAIDKAVTQGASDKQREAAARLRELEKVNREELKKQILSLS